MKLNGTVLAALRLALTERSLPMVSVSVRKVNLSNKENASTIQFARTVQNGTVNNVPEFHATLAPHLTTAVVVAKPQSSPVQLELIGTVTDASTSQTSAPLV